MSQFAVNNKVGSDRNTHDVTSHFAPLMACAVALSTFCNLVAVPHLTVAGIQVNRIFFELRREIACKMKNIRTNSEEPGNLLDIPLP